MMSVLGGEVIAKIDSCYPICVCRITFAPNESHLREFNFFQPFSSL